MMRKEDTLITSCANTEVSPALAKQLKDLVKENPDWEYVLQASLHHSVLPLIYQNLLKINPEFLPDTILQEMKNHFLSTVARNMYMAARLLKILSFFEEHGIIAVPFKGPVLAENVYGNLGLRNFGDLDILLWPYDAGRAIDLLSTRGFTPLIELSPSQFKAYMKAEDDMALTHQTDNLVVELHWEMTGRYLSRPLDMECISSRLETVTLLDRDVVHLSAEDLLLYMCIHGTRHMWERLEWICCVAELVRNRQDLQWDVVFRLAQELKCSRILRHGLYMAHYVLDVDIPAQVTKELAADPVLPQLAEQITNRLFPLYQPEKEAEGGNRFKRLQFQVRDSQLEKVGYGWRQLTVSREADWRWFPLPACLVFMYGILRPLRLGWQYISLKLF